MSPVPCGFMGTPCQISGCGKVLQFQQKRLICKSSFWMAAFLKRPETSNQNGHNNLSSEGKQWDVGVLGMFATMTQIWIMCFADVASFIRWSDFLLCVFVRLL